MRFFSNSFFVVVVLGLSSILQSCERIPESERRSVLLNQEETTRRLQDFRPWLWTCRAQDIGGQDQIQESLGQKMERFVDIFHVRGLSSVEDFEISQIRSAAFMWRESGLLISSLSALTNVRDIECTNGPSGWKKAEIKGFSRALDLIVLQVPLEGKLQIRNRWASRDDRPRIAENVYLLSASYPGQVDIQNIKVQPQLAQMRTGIDADLILFSPVPSEVFRGGVLIDDAFKVIGINSGDRGYLWGMAISASQIESTVTAILSKGAVEYPFLGFQLRPRDAGGLVVRQVEVGSPAYRAGLRVGDALIEWNGTALHTIADWIEPSGSDIEKNIAVTYERSGKKIETQITVGAVR